MVRMKHARVLCFCFVVVVALVIAVPGIQADQEKGDKYHKGGCEKCFKQTLMKFHKGVGNVVISWTEIPREIQAWSAQPPTAHGPFGLLNLKVVSAADNIVAGALTGTVRCGARALAGGMDAVLSPVSHCGSVVDVVFPNGMKNITPPPPMMGKCMKMCERMEKACGKHMGMACGNRAMKGPGECKMGRPEGKCEDRDEDNDREDEGKEKREWKRDSKHEDNDDEDNDREDEGKEECKKCGAKHEGKCEKKEKAEGCKKCGAKHEGKCGAKKEKAEGKECSKKCKEKEEREDKD